MRQRRCLQWLPRQQRRVMAALWAMALLMTVTTMEARTATKAMTAVDKAAL